MVDTGVTADKCREYQASCRGEILTAIRELAQELKGWVKETTEDRKEIHAELAALAQAIAYQKGLTNGHPHHRGTDPSVAAPLLTHQRKEDSSVIEWLKIWKWYVLLIVVLASYAGHEVVPIIEKLIGLAK